MINNSPLKLTPEIRFSQFKDNWNESRMGQLFREVNERVGKRNIETYSISSGVGFVSQKEKFGKDISGKQNERYIILRPGEFSYNKGNSKTYKYGCVYLNTFDTDIAVPNVFISFASNNHSIINEYFAKYFEAHKLDKELRKIISSTARMDGLLNVNKSNFFNLKVKYPNTIKEQKLISSFFGLIDNLINNYRKQLNLIILYRKSVAKKLFSKELRFKDESGHDYPDWIFGKLNDFFERITEKNKEQNNNVLTISAQQGLIKQEKYFNKSVSSKNLIGYQLIRRGDFAYNKSYSNGYPLGAIKMLNRYDKGVVSPLYICFRSKSAMINGSFMEKYFDAGKLNYEISKIAQEGARNHGLLNLGIKDFFEKVNVQIPTLLEQINISDFLTTIDNLIDNKRDQLQQIEKWKRGLLTKMLV